MEEETVRVPIEKENPANEIDKSFFQCRMYENKFPEVDDLVMVNVVQIADMGAYVHLLEYNNTEGMILLSELSRRRIRSIQKLIRVGRNEVVVVLRVDTEKGIYLLFNIYYYINLIYILLFYYNCYSFFL